MAMKERIFSLVNNKYGYVLIALFLYVLVLEETDLFTLMKYRASVSELEEQKEYFEEEITLTQAAVVSLTTDQAALEKFAREQHYMKRENEDLFVIIN